MRVLFLVVSMLLVGCSTSSGPIAGTSAKKTSIEVSIEGGVLRPGKYELTADRSLQRLVNEAGGLTVESRELITIQRRNPDGSTQGLNLDRSDMAWSYIPRLQDGDVVVVSTRPPPKYPPVDYSEMNKDIDPNDRRPIEVSIQGVVKNPARYKVNEGDSLWTLIEKAGPKDGSDAIKNITITRELGHGERRVYRISWAARDLEASPPLLHDQDIIYCAPGCWGL